MVLIDGVAKEYFEIGDGKRNSEGHRTLKQSYANKLAKNNPDRYRLAERADDDEEDNAPASNEAIARMEAMMKKIMEENAALKGQVSALIETRQTPAQAVANVKALPSISDETTKELTAGKVGDAPAPTPAPGNGGPAANQVQGATTDATGEATGQTTPGADDVDTTEAAAELAKANNIDITTVTGTGSEGRVKKTDVQKVIDANEEAAKKSRRPDNK